MGAGIDKDQGPGQHADLADPGKGPGADGGEAHHQVDHKKGKQGYQAQPEQIEGAILLDTGIERLELVAESLLNRILEQKAGDEKRQCSPQSGGK